MLFLFGEELVAQVRDRKLMPGLALVSGPPTTPFRVRAVRHHVRFFAVELTAIGLASFFGPVASELRDNMQPLDAFVPGWHHQSLTDALTELSTPVSKRREVEALLRQLLPQRLSGEHLRVHQFAQLAARQPTSQVQHIAQQLGVSAAFLRRSVGEAAGLSPKSLLESERLALSFRTVMDCPSVTTGALARELGYHDSAHFSRAFKRYTGHPPSRLPRASFALARTMMAGAPSTNRNLRLYPSQPTSVAPNEHG